MFSLQAAAGILLPTMFKPMSSYQDTDSSNESFESDTSCRINCAVNLMDDHENWIDNLTVSSWKTKNEKTLWPENRNKHWNNLPSMEEHSINWPFSESGGESFLSSLIRTPRLQRNFPPPPPKPDSPLEVLLFLLKYYKDIILTSTHTRARTIKELGTSISLLICLFSQDTTYKREHWKSWMSPTKFTYSQDEHSTNVQVIYFSVEYMCVNGTVVGHLVIGPIFGHV